MFRVLHNVPVPLFGCGLSDTCADSGRFIRPNQDPSSVPFDAIDLTQLRRSAAPWVHTTLRMWEFQFTVPSTVSVLWEQDEPARLVIEDALVRSVHAAMRHLVDRGVLVRRACGSRIPVNVEEAVPYAELRHERDPSGVVDLHHHVFLVNDARAMDGSWGPLDERRLRAWSVSALERHTTVFQAALARELAVCWEPRVLDWRGRTAFQLVGITDREQRQAQPVRAVALP
jgi:hypothetical protein